MRTIIFVSITIALAAFISEDFLTGRWETKPSPKGNVTSVVFKPDNTFEGFINRKPFTTGKYTLKDSIFTFTDNGCGGAEGVYKLILFSKGDSVRFEPISDTCVERKNGMSRTIMGRVK
jgi:hypothetical protein